MGLTTADGCRLTVVPRASMLSKKVIPFLYGSHGLYRTDRVSSYRYRRLPASTPVYRRLPASTLVYRRLPAYTGVYRRIPRTSDRLINNWDQRKRVNWATTTPNPHSLFPIPTNLDKLLDRLRVRQYLYDAV